VNDYISAVKSAAYEAFRNRYRSVDVLIIDDIHFLGVGTKTGSQEELFHTFNTLHNAQKQIVLSSDAPPNEIPSLEERLVSRFRWGMVASLTTPILETRIAILKNKLEHMGTDFPEEVIFFIASNIDTNIRDLEGALVKVAGYAELTGKPVTVDLAKETLKDLIKFRISPITIPDIQKVISEHFNINPFILQSKKRSKAVSIPRQIGIYLARTTTSMTLEEIGASFGGKDHTTVMYAVEKIKQRLHKDPQFKATLEVLTNRLKSVCK
jgi:chromosomal replication initiator protein